MYHACDTDIAPLNGVQGSFLAEPGLSSEEALLQFNLAPLESHRDIAMLGIIHRCALGKGPDHFRAFFKFANTPRRSNRAESRMHSKQLVDIRDRSFLEIERRRVFGLMWVYNRLLEDIISEDEIQVFQRHLNIFLKWWILSGRDDWKNIFSFRTHIYMDTHCGDISP